MNEKSLITPPSPNSDASSPAGSTEPDVRARPGRRTVEERQQAVLELFAGKATIDWFASVRAMTLPSAGSSRAIVDGGRSNPALVSVAVGIRMVQVSTSPAPTRASASA